MLENYKRFRIQSLIFEILNLSEGYIKGTSEFLNKLKNIKSNADTSSSRIADIILKTIDLERYISDRSLNQNYFDVTDQDDKVSFISTSRIPTDWDSDDDPVLPYTLSGRGELKIGRAVRYLLGLVGENATDKELEDFVNLYKSSSNSSNLEFKLVKGDDIRKYYNEDKYFSKSAGTLGNSCMKDESGKTFKIYTENPKKVRLLVLVDSDDKVYGRAIVWKLKESPSDSQFLMDRVYTNRDFDVLSFKRFADENNMMYKRFNTSHIETGVQFIYKGKEVNGVCTVKLDGDFSKYPYIDTMSFLSKNKEELSNVSSEKCYMLQNVYGDRERCEDCEGDIIIKGYTGGDCLCNYCSEGHEKLKELGIKTKWNKKV